MSDNNLFSPQEMADRLARIRMNMEERGLEALVTQNQVNIRYATGFRGEPHTLLLTAEHAVLYTSYRTLPWAEAQTQASKNYLELSTSAKPYDDIAQRLQGTSRNVGVDQSLSHTVFLKLETQLSPHRLQPCSEIEVARRVKSSAEIEIMKQSQRINEEIFNASVQQIRPGMSEREVQGIMLKEIAAREDVDGYSFTPIVAAGGNAWEIHHLPDYTKIQADDMLLLDLGVFYKGYASDMTRTICMGKATEFMQEIYQTIGEAQTQAIASMCPGAKTHDIDQAARDIITAAGYSKTFTHGLGHSIGLETHDPGLNLSPFTSNEILSPGMAFTVEPGIYLENSFGVRTEDIVIITENGNDNITAQTHQMIELNF